MNVAIDEAQDSYKEELVTELQSSNVEEMEANIETVVKCVEDWKRKHSENNSETAMDMWWRLLLVIFD